MIMVAGDQAAVHEAQQFFPGIEVAEVKMGVSRMRARLLPDDVAEERIRQAVKAAVKKDERPRPFRPLLPMELKIEYQRSDYCDRAAALPGVERLNGTTVRKISTTYLDFWL
jgi:D-amino peptidase